MSRFGARGELFAGAVLIQQRDDIRIRLESRAFLKNVVGDDEIAVLTFQFLFRVFKQIVRFCSEADEGLMRFLFAKCLGYVRIPFKRKR